MLKTIHFSKDSFCIPKGVLLYSKTSPFALQNESFCKPKGVLLKNNGFLLCKPSILHFSLFTFHLQTIGFFTFPFSLFTCKPLFRSWFQFSLPLVPCYA